MLDLPDRKPAAAKLIACPPRRQHKPADPCAMVIFGATGDLTKRLVVPALYNLLRSNVLPEHFALFGVARSDETSESWRDQLYSMLKGFVGRSGAEFNTDAIDEDSGKKLASRITYVRGDLSKPELYQKLRNVLSESEKANGTRGNVIFYLAIADQFFGTVIDRLGEAQL